VTIVGGLHHLHPNINDAIREIHRILKPGGLFCFAEPHSHTIPDAVRSFWYKHDSLFAANEASVDLAELEEYARNSFSFNKRLFSGNLGYLLVLNSMIFRIPVALKKFYAPAVMRIESVLNRFLGERTSCFVICQWQKQRLCEERDVATAIADYTAAART
jgi:SAM-dependent methyltransferase